MASDQNARELVLAPNEFAYILDQTKGDVNIHTGPNKTGLTQTDQPVLFNPKSKRFERASGDEAVQAMRYAPEGWYAVLKNPSKNGEQPKNGSRTGMPDLNTGHKIIIPGPCSFALWPGQMAKIVQGHSIRSNQYLLVRVYNEEKARANWSASIMRPSKLHDPNDPSSPSKEQEQAETSRLLGASAELTMGSLHVIRGTDVSFFIPPTGVEVVEDESHNLVREAVTLERLEYCLLKDQDGKKRYEQGPAVVFPRPTEIFSTRDVVDDAGTKTKSRKFKAIELSETSGIYLKVIDAYTDEETKKEYKVGDELFLTGADQMIYYPRQEHAIVKYGDQQIHYGVAIPQGEGRYVFDRITGAVNMVEGPKVYLPDPRKEVITRRVLDLKLVNLLYPGNQEALAHNASLAGLPPESLEARSEGGIFNFAGSPVAPGAAAGGRVGSASHAYYAASMQLGDSAQARGLGARAAKGFSGDEFDRKNQFTAPRTLTLRNKYDGVVSISIHTGYAVMLVAKNGKRRVELGPKTVNLAYDEVPQVMALSTGKPKTTDNLHQDVYLRVFANKISDVIPLQTKDYSNLEIKLSYRVNFEGDANKWFDVENYVKFLCDHVRSRLKSQVKKLSVRDFYPAAADILRTMILGESEKDVRPGMAFRENGMRIYDVEVLSVDLKDVELQKLLVGTEREAINEELALVRAEHSLKFTQANEAFKQEKLNAESETFFKALALEELKVKAERVLDQAKMEAEAQQLQETNENKMAEAKGIQAVEAVTLQRKGAELQLEVDYAQKRTDVDLVRLKAEVEALVQRSGAVTPGLVEALSAFGDKLTIQEVSRSLGPLGILGGTSVFDVLKKLLDGSPLAKHLVTTSNGVLALSGTQPVSGTSASTQS